MCNRCRYRISGRSELDAADLQSDRDNEKAVVITQRNRDDAGTGENFQESPKNFPRILGSDESDFAASQGDLTSEMVRNAHCSQAQRTVSHHFALLPYRSMR